ncbi:MAG: HutD family protein [Tardiphaga sp.]
MRILRATDYKVMPWKNGLGATTEIAVSPERDGLDDFAWRVSMAQVSSDGPFSSFPDIDRTLLVLAGQGMVLEVDGQPPATLTQASPPYAFAGDATTSARLVDGAIVDLNVMVRRGLVRARVERFDLAAPQRFSTTGVRLLFVQTGKLNAQSVAHYETLTTNDTLLFDALVPSLIVGPSVATTLISIELAFDSPHADRF